MTLKIRLVEAGVSTPEIERIINAGRFEQHEGEHAPATAKGKFAYPQ